MKENVFRKIEEGGQGIIRNEAILLPEYLPDQLVGRDSEVKEIALALKPACEGRKPNSLFIYGKTGTGKTSCARIVLRDLSEYAGRVVPLYVNCWEFSTRQAIFYKISEALQLPLPRRGLASDEVFSRVIEVIKREKKIPVIVLDEVDRLFSGNEERVLYDFARAEENFGAHIGVIGITNNYEAIALLDSRIKSSISRELFFKPYSPPQLKQILSERAEKAFAPNSCGSEVIALCAAAGAKAGGDARIAFETLWLAARNAEKNGRKTIGKEDVRQAVHEKSIMRIKQAMNSLIEGEKLVIDLLEKSGRKFLLASYLYKRFQELVPQSERNIRNHLHSLESKGLIRIEEEKTSAGIVRKVFLAEGV